MQYRIDPEFEHHLPPLSQEEADELDDKIRAEGCLPGALVVGEINGDYILVDGHNSRRIALAHGRDLPQPLVRKFNSRAEALQWIDDNQLARRNLPEAIKAARREARRERIAEARAEGQSIRAIAKAEKVSRATVERDLKDQGVTGVTPEKVKGEDGKEYPSKPDLRCERCKRTGGDGSKCPRCIELRNPRRVSDAKPSQRAEPSPNGTGTAAIPKPVGGLCPYCGRVWKGSTFIKPTVEQVAAYVKEIKAQHCEPEAFIDHFDSNGWKVGGKGRMTDWKAAVRNWERRGKEKKKPTKMIDEIRARLKAAKQ